MSLAYRISGFNRRRKWEQFVDWARPGAQLRVLDVGFSDREYSPTDNFLEKHYPYPQQITALGIDEPVEFPERYPRVRVVQYDGGEFPFADGEFDVCWSNAVVEHVGNRPRQLRFLREINRVARAGFITTPNRHFPIEVHTRTPLLHFLPRSWFECYLRCVGKKWATGDYMHLLSHGDLCRLLDEAGVRDYTITRNRLGPFTLDFVVTWGNPQNRDEVAAETGEKEQLVEAGA